MKERLIDDYWMEKIHNRNPAILLSAGDNIYYRDPTIKGFWRWKPGVIIDRKGQEENNGRLIDLKGYDILDTVTGKHTTRTREDIRIKKKTKLEDKIYKEYIEFLNKMHRASNESTQGEDYKKPLFKESYEKPPENQFQPPTTRAEHVEKSTDPPEQEPSPTMETPGSSEEIPPEEPAPTME